jgi:hypothetical protein
MAFPVVAHAFSVFPFAWMELTIWSYTQMVDFLAAVQDEYGEDV